MSFSVFLVCSQAFPWFKDRTHFSAPSLFWLLLNCYPFFHWSLPARLISPACLCQPPCLQPYHCPQAASSTWPLQPRVHPPEDRLSAGLRPGLVCPEKKGLRGCRGDKEMTSCFQMWVYRLVWCLQEGRNINQHRKDLMRAKEKSLLLHRLLETKY